MTDSATPSTPDATAEATPDAEAAATQIEQGTYEIIRDRLIAHGRELAAKADTLNEERVATFGGTEMAVIGTERVRTENNCVPRDIVAIGNRLFFGYNVFLGLRTETNVGDVFSLHRFRKGGDGSGGGGGAAFEFANVSQEESDNFLTDARFAADFRDLYRFFKDAELLALRRFKNKMVAAFKVGRTLADVKALRWSIDTQGGVTYLDNQGDRDHSFPPTHDFEWTETTRENHRAGRHPHVSILDEVFVETVGGDLTIKVEDNTGDGGGIYAEPVDDSNQSLDDADVHYAKLGTLILLKIRPYREEVWRYLVFNTLTKAVSRIDHIGHACVQLPEDHGIIFPGGYYLQRGETKTYAADITGMQYERVVSSPNGEDVLYVFHRPDTGLYVLLPYNMIRKEVMNPIRCHGYCLFDDGNMVVFRAKDAEPTRVHPMQIWQTPFTSDVYADQRPVGDSILDNIGNPDLVRGISDCLSIRRMTEEQSPTRAMYEELIAATVRVMDTYHWLENAEVGNLLATLKQVRATSELIVDEFEKVQALREQASGALAKAETEFRELVNSLTPDFWKLVDDFVQALADLRRQRGQLITLREVRYIDLARVNELEAEVVEHFDTVSRKCVDFLLKPAALKPYLDRITKLEEKIPGTKKVTETAEHVETLDGISVGLDLLTEVVGGLQIDDATVRTQILEGISEVMGAQNRTRALLVSRRKELLTKEGAAEFGAQFMLFSQSVTSALGLADTPEKCDEQLSRLMLQLEDLEGRFSEFDDFLNQLATKREEVYEALESKKQTLADQRQRRAQHMMGAVERILGGIARRAATFEEVADLNAYFASDAMIMKARDLAEKLRDLGDSVKADEAESRLKSARQDAIRALRDHQDIFEDGANVIRLGKHRFSVNTQALDLTMIPREKGMALHLTGTGFYDDLDDAEFEATRPYWDQDLVSETPDVYRGEYLAYTILAAAEEAENGTSLQSLRDALRDDEGLLPIVREVAGTRYDEGYERGVHDVDATRILTSVLAMYTTAGLLRFAPFARAAANLFWSHWEDTVGRRRVARQSASLARLRSAFRHSQAINALQQELAELIAAFHERHDLPLSTADARAAGRYLFEELGDDPDRVVVSGEAEQLKDAFLEHLVSTATRDDFDEDLRSLEGHLAERLELVSAWLDAWLTENPSRAELRPVLHEAAVLMSMTVGGRATATGSVPSAVAPGGEAAQAAPARKISYEVSTALGSAKVTDLLGQHPRIGERTMAVRLDEFLGRLSAFSNERVPAYRAYQALRHKVLERERDRLRLSEYMPKVMTAFVRNKLINEVYLPLFGDNLAKQLGALGAGKRTDLMGLLLLISPPGYGKTTLMEYLANRLGLVFMKINGPALGHNVTSLDPDEAPNATARQEVEKLNLALEMGNNVLIYLDDIQHTHPELLQKFISLCDAQRKIEGVWRGKTKTYDLRGKKVVVCMAGNPYTESGEKFQIPDMLANRADVYNLGDILGGRDDLFALSYIENALTSNSVLAQVTTNAHDDIYLLVRMAKGEDIPATELSHPYSQVELEEIKGVLRKVLRIQELLLAVNQEYIASASMDDAYRTEPPFKLQGSYRNMNKLAEKIVPVMNDQELESLFADHYLGEAQTLTTGAEQNLLKLAELRGGMSDEDSRRWGEIKDAFRRQQMMGGKEDDPATKVTGQLIRLSDRLDSIGTAINTATETAGQRATADAAAAAAAAASQAESKRDRDDDTPAIGTQIGNALAPHLVDLQSALASVAEASAAARAESDDDSGNGAEQMEAALGPYLERIDESLARLTALQATAATAEPVAPTDAVTQAELAELLMRQIQVTEAGLLPILSGIGHSMKIENAVFKRLGKVLHALKAKQGRAAGTTAKRPVE